MGEAVILKDFLQFGGSLGTGVLFVYLYFKERGESQKKIADKDQHIRNMNQQVLSAFQENSKASVELANSIKHNTEASKTLTERVTSVIINRKG